MDFDDTLGSESDDSMSAELRVVYERGEPSLMAMQGKARLAAEMFGEPFTPTKIGRFTILRELGAGGMGVVYVAYDEELDRRVAVKLLRESSTDTQGKARLQREAQAMARLSHPNVVTVHEVGTHLEQVFVAMEFVPGGDLRAWLRSPRTWREVVAMFCQAGEGLAAAHDAGLVHRDFKPDNVLVGVDGRARVADFGLAYARAQEPEREPSGEAPRANLDRTLTQPGAVMGTPAYMSPEQLVGDAIDVRTDQFAFCVALWEGLYGKRPFTAPNFAALVTAVREGRIVEPVVTHDVPAWLHAALVRGLSADADARWPSMHALLAVLGNDAQARRRRTLRIAAIAGLAALVIAGLSTVIAAQLRENARRSYWVALTEELLDIERTRGLRQVTDDAMRARDATRMSVFRSFRPLDELVNHEDPTVAAVLLREVEGPLRESSSWISAANETLGQPISRAVLDGHRDVVTALVFSPSEPVLYSAGSDGAVWRWDLDTALGQPIIAHDEGKEVTGLVASPDGRTLISVSKDRTVRSWSAQHGARVVATHEDELTDVAFAPDGRRIVASSRDAIASVHELETGGRVDLRGHDKAVFAVGFDPSGTRVLTGSSDKTVRLWRADDGQLLATLEGHEQGVFHVAFVGSDLVVSGSDDGSVRLWRLDGDALVSSEILGRHTAAIAAVAIHGRQVASSAVDGAVAIVELDDPSSWRVVDKHPKGVWALAFTPTGEGLISAGFDTTARLHDLHARVSPRIFKGHRLALLSAAIDPSGRWLATGAWDGQVRIWDLERPMLSQELAGHTARVGAVAFDAGGTRAVTSSHDGSARIWRTSDASLLATLAGGHKEIIASAFSPDGRKLVAGTRSGVVELWELETGARLDLTGHTHNVSQVGFNLAGDRIGSVSYDGTARIWSLAGEAQLILSGHEARVVGIDFGRPGQPIATASFDGTLRLWDSIDGHQRAVLRSPGGPINAFARNEAGVLASACDDGSAQIWPDEDPTHMIALEGHSKAIWSIAFDASGERLVTASADGSARVWDLEGHVLASLSGHTEAVWGARFLDSEQVITVSNDRRVRLWSLAEPERVIVLPGHRDAIMGLDISADGRWLITASADKSARLWQLELLSRDPAWLSVELERATSYCLSVDERERELGEASIEAKAGLAACEQNRRAGLAQ
jgi:WD40 repeat protein